MRNRVWYQNKVYRWPRIDERIEHVCEVNKNRVCIESVSWEQTLGFEGWFTLGNTIRIESLGHGRRLGLWVELGGRLILVTHWYLFCKVTHHYSETDDCSLLQTRSIWTELCQQILLCSLFLSLAVFYFWLVFIIVPYTLFWLLDYPLLHTSSLLLVWFFIEFTTERYHRKVHISIVAIWKWQNDHQKIMDIVRKLFLVHLDGKTWREIGSDQPLW